MADEQAKKILGGRWAYSATDRVNPEDATPALTRRTGFPTSFETTETPERGVINQLLCELNAAAYDQLREGILPYDADIDYPEGAFVKHGDPPLIKRALQDNGPSSVVAAPTNTTYWDDLEGETSVPDAPATPQARIDNGVIHWTWLPGSDNGAVITSYIIQVREQNGTWSADINLTACSYDHTSLTNGDTYEARVRAVNSEGNSPWTNPAGTGSPSASRPAGGAQLALRATAGDGRIELDWLEPENNGSPILRYRYQWKSGGQAYGSAREVTVTGLSATVTSLSNGTEYDFRVRSESVVGNSDWSNEESASPEEPFVAPVPDPDTVPDAPMSLSGTARRPLAVDWKWNTPADGGQQITGYQLQWRYAGDAWSGKIITVTEGCARSLVANTSTAVEARVLAINSVGSSAWSSTEPVTSANLLGDLGGTRYDSTQTITWNRDETKALAIIVGAQGGSGAGGGGGGGGAGADSGATIGGARGAGGDSFGKDGYNGLVSVNEPSDGPPGGAGGGSDTAGGARNSGSTTQPGVFASGGSGGGGGKGNDGNLSRVTVGGSTYTAGGGKGGGGGGGGGGGRGGDIGGGYITY